MEYCEKTLEEAIGRERLHETPDRLWSLFRQLVAGCAYIHSRGIVHRRFPPHPPPAPFAARTCAVQRAC